MPQKNVFQPAAHDRGKQFSRCMVGKVSIFAQYALFQQARVSAFFQHFHIMVCLKQQDIAVRQCFTDFIGHMSNIRCQCGFAVLRHHVIAHRLRRIMRYGKRAHADIVHRTDLAGVNIAFVARRNFPEAVTDCRPGFLCCVNRHMKTAGNDSRALYMVYMFMGQEQCVNILAGDTQLAQRILYALAADPRVNQYFGIFRPNICAVAAAPAGNRTKLHVKLLFLEFKTAGLCPAPCKGFQPLTHLPAAFHASGGE